MVNPFYVYWKTKFAYVMANTVSIAILHDTASFHKS